MCHGGISQIYGLSCSKHGYTEHLKQHKEAPGEPYIRDTQLAQQAPFREKRREMANEQSSMESNSSEDPFHLVREKIEKLKHLKGKMDKKIDNFHVRVPRGKEAGSDEKDAYADYEREGQGAAASVK